MAIMLDAYKHILGHSPGRIDNLPMVPPQRPDPCDDGVMMGVWSLDVRMCHSWFLHDEVWTYNVALVVIISYTRELFRY